MKAYNIFIGCIWIFALIMLFFGCGSMNVSDSKHEVGGEATIRVVIGIDVTACEGLNSEDKLECIQAMVDLAKTIEHQTQSGSDALPTIQ